MGYPYDDGTAEREADNERACNAARIAHGLPPFDEDKDWCEDCPLFGKRDCPFVGEYNYD